VTGSYKWGCKLKPPGLEAKIYFKFPTLSLFVTVVIGKWLGHDWFSFYSGASTLARQRNSIAKEIWYKPIKSRNFGSDVIVM